MIKILVISAFVLQSASASALDMTVFGFELGRPLALPECKFEPAGPAKVYYPVQAITCLEENRTPGDAVTARILRFASSDRPEALKDGYAILVESRGQLIGFQFSTYGVRYQQAVYDDLKAKYGKPAAVRMSLAQNAFGASFSVLHARWTFKAFAVTFDGADTETDEGTVTVDMPDAARARARWESDRNTGKKL